MHEQPLTEDEEHRLQAVATALGANFIGLKLGFELGNYFVSGEVWTMNDELLVKIKKSIRKNGFTLRYARVAAASRWDEQDNDFYFTGSLSVVLLMGNSSKRGSME